MMKDMAYGMVGGLIASTILAMFLMPAFYLLIRRGEFGRHQAGAARAKSKRRSRPGPPSPDARFTKDQNTQDSLRRTNAGGCLLLYQ